jgi:hypothetical protein
MRGRAILYSADELAWIERRKDWKRSDLHAAFRTQFGRADVSCAHIKALCKRRGWFTGRTGRFDPGAVPANKGKKMPYHPNSAATRFKKGNLPHNTQYLGHERLSKDGYVEISVDQPNPHTGFSRRYVQKHRWLWEQANGPVPAGMVLKCLGDKLDTDPSNWKLVPRAILPRLNGRFGRGYDTAAAEVKPTIMAIAELEHRARMAKAKEQGGE